jgi:hypothetical protein
MTSRLDAINSCLAGVGLQPVASEDDTDLDAATASATIDRVTNELLGAGWWFNREDNWKLAPEPSTGEIPLAANVMQIEPTGTNKYCKLVIRSRKVYDMTAHTFNLVNTAEDFGDEGYLSFTFIVSLSFEDIPPLAKAAITTKARRLFAQDTEVDATRWNFQIRDDAEAMKLLHIEEARSRKGNYLKDNPTAATNIQIIGGYNSRGGYQTTFLGKRYN